jgi:YfiH family protein
MRNGLDAYVVDSPGAGAGVLVADCLPVLVVAEHACAVVHAGWRGMTRGVIEAALAELAKTSRPVAAFIGPSIGACCFEVDTDVAERFALRWPDTVVMHAGRHRPHVDLRLAAAQILAGSGVDAVYPLGPCTRCSLGLFSHRRGDVGRQALVAAVSETPK